MSYESERAKQTLVHYFREVWKKAGLNWDSDNVMEVQGIVDDLVKAAVPNGAISAKKVEQTEELIDLLAGISLLSSTRISQRLLEFRIRSWEDFKKRVEGGAA